MVNGYLKVRWLFLSPFCKGLLINVVILLTLLISNSLRSDPLSSFRHIPIQINSYPNARHTQSQPGSLEAAIRQAQQSRQNLTKQTTSLYLYNRTTLSSLRIPQLGNEEMADTIVPGALLTTASQFLLNDPYLANNNLVDAETILLSREKSALPFDDEPPEILAEEDRPTQPDPNEQVRTLLDTGIVSTDNGDIRVLRAVTLEPASRSVQSRFTP